MATMKSVLSGSPRLLPRASVGSGSARAWHATVAPTLQRVRRQRLLLSIAVTAARDEGPATGAQTFAEWRRANPPATAAAFTGLYAVAAGLALLAAPRPTLGLLFADAAAVPSGWIRVGGVLFATFGLQYLGAALGDFWLSKGGIRDEKGRAATAGQPLPPAAEAEAEAEAAEVKTAAPPPTPPVAGSLGFYWATVWARLALAAAFFGLVAAGCCERGLLVLAALNAAGAASMAAALRRQQQQQQKQRQQQQQQRQQQQQQQQQRQQQQHSVRKPLH